MARENPEYSENNSPVNLRTICDPRGEDFGVVGLKRLETYGGVAIMLVCEAADFGGFPCCPNKARRSNEICVIGD